MHKNYEPIAIVGIAGRFPGATNIHEFWKLLEDGQSPVQEIPIDRWDNKLYFDSNEALPGKIYVNHGYFLNAVDQFDPQFFHISPKEAVCLDPQHRLLLEVSWEAFMNASISTDSLFNSNTGVFIGLMNQDYGNLITRFSKHTNVNFLSGMGNSTHCAAGRLSYTYGLQGPCLTLDTACSSSLVALHQACRALSHHECDLALTGAVNLILDPYLMISMCNGKVLARDGRCKTFDESADGYGRGEGCGFIVLKRLSDALSNNDNILAIIKGSAVNQNGPGSGLTVPNGNAQRSLMQRTMTDAGVNVNEVDYIEAHGSATQLGDLIEMNSIAATYGAQRDSHSMVYVSSVKTNIGHLEAASGMAGLIKIVLSLHHETIPMHLHLKKLNPYFDIKDSGIIIPDKNIFWKKGDRKRVAAINSFGISGTNAHVIIEEPGNKSILKAYKQPSYNRKRYWSELLDNNKQYYKETSLFQANSKDVETGIQDVVHKHQVNMSRQSYLLDHQIFNQVVFPASGFIDLTLSFIKQIDTINKLTNASITLTDMRMDNPLHIDMNAPSGLKIISRKSHQLSHHDYMVKIVSDTDALIENDKPETRLFKCNVSLSEEVKNSNYLNIVNLKNIFAQITNIDEVYELMRHHGMSYGSRMRTIKRLWKLENQSLAELSLSVGQYYSSEARHTILIDGAFQVVALNIVMDQLKSGQPVFYLPIGIKQINYFLDLPDNIYVYIKYKNENIFSEMLEVDIQIHDTSGNLVIDINGLYLKKTNGSVFQDRDNNSIDDYSYEEQWDENQPRKTRSVHTRHWLIIGNENVYGDYLQVELEKSGNVAVLTDYEFDLTTLSDECNAKFNNLHGIIYLGFDGGPANINSIKIDVEKIENYLEKSCNGLFRLLKSLHRAGHHPDLVVVTRGARCVNESDTVDPVQSTLWGIMQCARYEYTDFKLYSIDMDSSEVEPAGQLKQLINELNIDDGELQIALRKGRRYVSRVIHSQRMSHSQSVELPQLHGTYLITGGLGGLGQLMIEWLRLRGVRNIVTVNRSAPTESQCKNIQQWKIQGLDVRSYQADVSDYDQLDRILRLIRNSQDNMPVLKGIIHIAGVLSDKLIANQQWEDYQKVFIPKIRGTLNLHLLTKNDNLDHFILFSSIASVIGAPGQSNYAAANAFMDAFSQYRHSSGLTSLSINWGPWSEVGMAKDFVALHHKNGIRCIRPDKEGKLFDKLINLKDVAKIMIADIDVGRLMNRLPDNLSAQYSHLLTTSGSFETLPSAEKKINTTVLVNLSRLITDSLRVVLGFNHDHIINPDDNFFDLGMDSLFAMQFHEHLRENLRDHIDLPMVAIFQNPTINSLKKIIENNDKRHD